MEKILKICKGYGMSMAAFAFLTFVGALAMRFTPFPETWGEGYVVACLTLACLFVGLYISGCFQRAGILTGMLSSAVLILLVFAITGACLGSFFRFSMLTPGCFVPLCAGALGGHSGSESEKVTQIQEKQAVFPCENYKKVVKYYDYSLNWQSFCRLKYTEEKTCGGQNELQAKKSSGRSGHTSDRIRMVCYHFRPWFCHGADQG